MSDGWLWISGFFMGFGFGWIISYLVNKGDLIS